MSQIAADYRLDGALLGPVLALLDAHIDPYLGRGLVSAGCVTSLAMQGDRLQLGLSYPYPCSGIQAETAGQLATALTRLPAIKSVDCEFSFVVPKTSADRQGTLARVAHIIAVASGKGGVGKSTTAVNLALALAVEGARVGILDADIYGPSIPLMLGIADFQPQSDDGVHMNPARAHGICAQSIGFIINEEQAAVWRGPMAAGALAQLINETAWPELDYLVVDMPPGTGDIQLTLSQKVAVSGAVVVTTPQDIALLDAKKGVNLFQKVNIPVLGIVENMSYHLCPACGHKEHPFGAHGGDKIAQRYGVPMLGALPLNIRIREGMDVGQPSVVAEPSGELAAIYREIARKVGAQLALSHSQSGVSISLSDDE
ncbi:iron-sulfur cluster carrier protein ApbC [Shewanella cyperi]|uniref:iron-sulfur cluster carrier protein ApbC n=1 Tax=Shewanella cyperi TaxID=2814292 RepID=UPI001A94EEBA|nr:iron-sulfur cluster carrier protein ApbC [Shewanella cyperi]QSX39372.1 iron-sulfur cluster carrier protein ApbC [Shewanella cyperi]